MDKAILLDTSALYALISATDQFHQLASRAYQEILDANDSLYVTSYILVETSALVHHRLGFPALKTLVDSLTAVAETLWVNADIHQEAWRRMIEFRERRFSFVDWTSAVVAERMGTTIFTFDREFRSTGLLVVPT